MKKTFITLFLSILALVFFAGFALAAFPITLEWDPSPSPITGYKIHYKTGESGGAPYDGTGILEGGSPIDVGNVLTITLTGLSETQDYYFVATAYDGIGRESDYSNEVASLRPQPPGNLIMRLAKKIAWILQRHPELLQMHDHNRKP